VVFSTTAVVAAAAACFFFLLPDWLFLSATGVASTFVSSYFYFLPYF